MHVGKNQAVHFLPRLGAEKSSLLDSLPSGVAWQGFTPDGKQLVAAAEKSFSLWDIATGKETRRFEGCKKPIECIAFSPNQKFIATAGGDMVARVWDAASGRIVHETPYENRDEQRLQMSFTPDGKMLALLHDRGIRFWNVADGKVRDAKIDLQYDGKFIFSPDGKKLVWWSLNEADIHFWDCTPESQPARGA